MLGDDVADLVQNDVIPVRTGRLALIENDVHGFRHEPQPNGPGTVIGWTTRRIGRPRRSASRARSFRTSSGGRMSSARSTARHRLRSPRSLSPNPITTAKDIGH